MTTGACGTLVHQAFPYGSPDAFVAGMVPFVRSGLERGDRVLAVTTPRNVDALREALDADAEAVDFRPAEAWYQQPYRTLQAYDRYVAAHANGGIVRVIGEPVWHGRSPSAVREWARYESVLNAAFASSPAWIVCPYDVTALPAEIVEHARHTHPEVLEAPGARGRSAAYLPPDAYVESPDAVDAAVPPRDAWRFAAGRDDVGAVRRSVAEAARAAGLADARVDELLLAVSEIASNAIRHGRPPVVVTVWRDADELVCEVEDAGGGFADRLTGYRLPSLEATSGRGLWIARQLCDCVDVLRRDGRFAVRLRVGLHRR